MTGIVLIKPQSCRPVLKSRELELKAGKPVHKERRSVAIQVKSRNLWLKSTQQTSVHCLRKVRKTSSKHNPSEQPFLGKFFAKTKTQSKAKGKAKGKASWPVCCSSFAKAHRIVKICDDPLNSDVFGGQNSIEALRAEKESCLPGEAFIIAADEVQCISAASLPFVSATPEMFQASDAEAQVVDTLLKHDGHGSPFLG